MKFNFLSWKNVAYSFLLTFGVFFIHYLTDIFGIEKLVVDKLWYGWIVLFIVYMLGILIIDLILRMVLLED